MCCFPLHFSDFLYYLKKNCCRLHLKKTCCAKRKKKNGLARGKIPAPPPDIKWSVPNNNFKHRRLSLKLKGRINSNLKP